jgi:hypothetical protein
MAGASAAGIKAAPSAAAAISEEAGAVAACSAHAAEPPKSAPDRLSAISIFFIRVPQPYFVSY